MLRALQCQEVSKICRKIERSSRCLVEAAQRTAAAGDSLADLDLAFCESPDAVLASRDDRRQLRLRDAVEELLNITFNRIGAREDHFHGRGVTGDFLLAAACKGFEPKV